jgi:hypothetical protein
VLLVPSEALRFKRKHISAQFLFFYFIVLLFICAYKAWVISPLCPHPLPHHPLHPLPLLPTPSIPGTVSNTEHLILKANI